MANKVITKLNTTSLLGSYRDNFEQAGRRVEPNLTADHAISKKAREQLFALIQSYARNSDTPIGRITPTEIFNKNGAKIGETSKEFRDKFRSIVQKGRIEKLSEGLSEGEVAEVNRPEPGLLIDGVAVVSFVNMRSRHYLDGIAYPRNERLPGESRESHIHRITHTLGREKYDKKKSKTRDTLLGVAQSLVPRRNYRMKVTLDEELQAFFERKKQFTTTEVFAKNGYVDGAVVSSFNRYAERVTLMRAVEAEDGSIDWLAGRVSNLETAQSMASFAFLSQINAPERERQGIQENEDGTYDFYFMAQSLLPMFGGSETKMVEKEIEAYEELASLKESMTITDPKDSSKTYQVRFRPLPVATSQFNWAQSLEKVLPAAISGENAARKASAKADDALIKFSETVNKTERAKALGLDLTVYQEMVDNTIYFLEEGKKGLKHYEELMARSFLCHLLGIPQIVHCKSCVDRTNIAGALITAMKQWMRTDKEIPKRDGLYAIFDLPKQNNEVGTQPFRELVSFSLHRGLKLTELSRGSKGYKWAGHRLVETLTLNPALVDILPLRYINIKPTNSWPVVAAKVAAIALVLIFRLAFYLLSWLCFWNIRDRLDAHPIEVVKNVTSAFFPETTIKREHNNIIDRQLMK
jgi:hypothetical protein